MSEKIVQLNEEVVKGQIKELVRGKTCKKQKGVACPGRGNAPALLSGGASPQKRKPIFPHKSSHTAALQCGCFIHPGIIHSFAQGHPWLCFRQSGASVPP